MTRAETGRPAGRIFRAGALVLGAALFAVALTAAWGLHVAGSAPVQRRASVALPEWPAGTAPLRVALLSDIHMDDARMSSKRLREILTRVAAARPDLVLLAGDFVNGHSVGDPAAADSLTAPLAEIRPRYGVVAVLGNHDYWTNPETVRAALERAGVRVLDNDAMQAGPIALVGVSDAFTANDRTDAALALASGMTGPRVVLTHSPDVVHDLPADVRLTLAGHTHCGQIVLPLIGALVERSPRQNMNPLYDPAFRCGLISSHGRTVVVTAGVGTGALPVRIGAPPDWWLLELGPGSPGSQDLSSAWAGPAGTAASSRPEP